MRATDVMVSWLPLSHDMGMLAFLALPMQYGVELVAVQARGVPAPPGAVGGPDQPLPRNHHLGTELRLRAARLDSRTGRTRPLRPVQPARGDQRRRTHRRPRHAVAWPRRAHASDCAPGRSPRRTAWPRPRWPSRSTTRRQVNVDRISRSDLQERALATPDAGADACGVVSVGLPVAGMEVRVVDDRSRPCPPRHVGSIEVRGAAVSRGYLTEYGWLRGGHP